MLQMTSVKNITVKDRHEQTKDSEGQFLGLVWLHVRPSLLGFRRGSWLLFHP